jgi:hypothetical protein
MMIHLSDATFGGETMIGNRSAWRKGLFGLSLASASLLAQDASGQAPSPPAITIPSIGGLEDLVRLSPAQLDALYANGTATAIPAGKVKGRAIYFPGTSMAVPASRAARLIWQGKVFDPSGRSAVNRFFGVKAVRAEVYAAESWRDGNPALILDYSETSKVYARYRDEIRQVAPGLYLGLMYARTSPSPSLKMYFALSTCD